MMSNNVLFFVLLIVQFSLTVLIYRLFGKVGLFVWICAGIIIANIQVLKTIELFGMTATLGNSLYGSIYLATDLLSEVYGKKDAKKAVYLGFFMMLSFTLIIQLVMLFKPDVSDFADGPFQLLFTILPRITLGSLMAYIVSQILDVNLFFAIKKKFGKKNELWIRNNFSTLISQFVDTLIFVIVAFYGVFSIDVLTDIFITTYILKAISSIMDTPFVYLMRGMGIKNVK